jgi:hypothetical protein
MTSIRTVEPYRLSTMERMVMESPRGRSTKPIGVDRTDLPCYNP